MAESTVEYNLFKSMASQLRILLRENAQLQQKLEEKQHLEEDYTYLIEQLTAKKGERNLKNAKWIATPLPGVNCV